MGMRWTPHPVIVTTRNGDYIRVLLYSCYTTGTGWGVLLRYEGPVHVLQESYDTVSTSSVRWVSCLWETSVAERHLWASRCSRYHVWSAQIYMCMLSSQVVSVRAMGGTRMKEYGH